MTLHPGPVNIKLYPPEGYTKLLTPLPFTITTSPRADKKSLVAIDTCVFLQIIPSLVLTEIKLSLQSKC